MKKIITIILLLGGLMSNMAAADDKENLTGGVRFHSIHRDFTNTATLVVFIRGGLFRENPQNNGIGALFARTWLKSGTLLEKVEYIGGGVNAGMASDYLEFTLSVPAAELSGLMGDVKKQILSPELSESVFQREKELLLRELEAEKDDPNSIAFQLFMEATYKNHPYAMRTEGTSAAVSKLTLKDVQNYYSSSFRDGDMIAVLAGNFSSEQLNEIKSILTAVTKGKTSVITCAGADIRETEYAEATDPRIQQSQLFLAYSAPSAGTDQYVYGKILNDLLGGGMSSPYFTALRKEKGYAYSVGTMYPSRICSSRLIGYIGLQAENVEDALHVMQQINKTILESVTDEDLEKTRNHIIGELLLEAETNSRTAWYAAFFENLGRGFDHTEKYVDQLRKVTKEDLQQLEELFNKPYTAFVYKPVSSENPDN